MGMGAHPEVTRAPHFPQGPPLKVRKGISISKTKNNVILPISYPLMLLAHGVRQIKVKGLKPSKNIQVDTSHFEADICGERRSRRAGQWSEFLTGSI